MALKVQIDEIENRQLSMTIEVDQERVDSEMRKAARKLAQDYRIPGFRKGKAPFAVILQHFGKYNLYTEFMDDLGQEVYREALEQESIEPYAQASLEDVNLEPLTYTMVVPLEPEVDLGDYRSVRVEQEPIEIDEAAVTERLESYREQYAGWTEVSRVSQYGDMMNVDVKSVVIPASGEADEASEPVVVLDESDWDVTPDQENPMEPPGFDEALLGMAPEEEKEFILSWPEDSQSIYAGKQARFNVKLNSIQAYEKPELDDDFAQLVGPDFETLVDLIANIRQALTDQAQQEAENDYMEKALDAVLAQSKLTYPPVVIEDQLDSMMREFEGRLRQFGIDSLDTYLQNTGQSVDEYRSNLRDGATRIAERNLIISELLRAEMIEVSDEEIEARIDEMVGSSGEEDESTRDLVEMFRSGAGRPIIESQILQRKAVERLLAIVRGEEVPLPEATAAGVDADPASEETPAEAEAEAASASTSEGEMQSSDQR